MSFHGGGRGGRGQSMKRRFDGAESEPKGKKNPLEVMQMVIKNSQKELQQKTSDGLPQDPEALKQIFTRQQMLLELQTEMMSQMAENEACSKASSQKEETVAYPKRGQKLPNEDFYYGFNAPKQGPSGCESDARRFNEDRHDMNSGGMRGGPPEPLMHRDFGPPGFHDDFNMWAERGMEMRPERGMRMRPERGMGMQHDMGPPRRMGMGGPPRGMMGMGAGPRDYGPPRGRGMRFQGRGGGRGRDSRSEDPRPAHQKGRGMPPTPEDAWDFRGTPDNPLNRPYRGMPAEDRITMLKREVFKYDNFPQPLRLLETARHNYTAAHIRTCYIDQPIEGTEEEYIGYLDFNGVLMAVERGVNKIDAKVNCYGKALYMLACKPTSYIFINSTRLHQEHKHPNKLNKNHTFVPDRLEYILDALHEGVHSLTRTAPNRDFEEIIYQLQLSITQIFKPSAKGFSCDMYVDDLFIATGEALDKFIAHKEAFTNARLVLFKDPSRNHKLLEKEGRLSSIDFFDPEIAEIRHSEYKSRLFANVGTLHSKGVYNKDLLKTKEDIVAIVPVDETSDWKCVDETSTANDLLMEYVENGSGTSARCTVYLQGICYADSYSSKVDSARQVAMGRAKYILLLRCTKVVERKNVDYTSVALTFEQVVEKARELCMSQPKLLDGRPKPEYKTSDKDPQPNDTSPWVDAFLKDLIYSYGQTDGLDDLIISYLPSYHTKILIEEAKAFDVAVEATRFKNTPYTVIEKAITKRLSSQEFIDYMKAHDCLSGRYKLTFKEANVASDLIPKKIGKKGDLDNDDSSQADTDKEMATLIPVLAS